MPMITGTRHYTNEQKTWMIEKSKMPKYRSKQGDALRRSKLVKAFNREFKQNRPIDGFGVSIRRILSEVGTAKRTYKPRVVKEQPLTLDYIEKRLSGIMAMVETVKGFMKL